MSYATVPLNASHKKGAFNCGKPMLDTYLHSQAKQDVKRKLSACFILADDDNNVKGYYTLSSAVISRDLLPEDIRKRLPPAYNDLPTTLLGRLAVDSNYQGQKLGEFLLMDALKRSLAVSQKVGSMAVIVDPIDEGAVNFYKKFDFTSLPDSGKMFLPMVSVAEIFSTH
jgi:ribosomal protein S18 acetylase RimI-like enzyme